MALNFPSSPAVNDTYTLGTKTWAWNGSAWAIQSGALVVLPSNFESQLANRVLAAPDGSAGTPTFRTLAAADIPNLDAAKITTGTISAARLPSFVDDVLEYVNLAGFPATGETGKIYVALDTNKTYRWSGSAYIYITSGAVDSVAGRTGVITLTSTDVGLANVENKSSATIRGEITSSNVTTALGFTPYNAANPSGYITSSALTPYLTSATAASTYLTGITSTQVTTALGFTPYNATNPSGYITNSALSGYLTSSSAASTYQPILVSGTNIKTVNGTSLLGSGNLAIGGSAWIRKTANYTAVAGDKIVADTTAGSFTVTLPASPTVGQSVIFADGGSWKTNNLIVARNASTIEGVAENLTIDVSSIQLELVYDGTTWQIYAATASSGVAVSTNTANTSYSIVFTGDTSGNQSNAYISQTNLYFNPSTGTLSSTNFNSLSDVNKKTNIVTIDNALDTVKQLRGVTFNWKDSGEASLGVIAQEIESVLPMLVSTSSSGEKSVSYGNIVGILIEAVKQQQAQIDLLIKKAGI